MVKRSIFRKLLVTMVGLIISLLTLLTFIQIEFQKQVFEKELDKRISLMKGRLIDGGHILSDNLSEQVRNGIASANFSQVGDQLKTAVKENKELDYIILMQNSGRVYIHTLKPKLEMSILTGPEDVFAAIQKDVTVNEFLSDGKSIMEFIMPLQVSAKPWGALRLGFSLATLNQEIVNSRKESNRQIRDMIVQLVITTLVFILVGACVVLLVSERLSRPLMHLTRLADALSQGDFSVSDKVKKIQQDGEIGALTKAFMQMAKSLKVSYDKLQEYSRTLEQKVLERTSELAEARDRAIAADKSKSEFLSMMSHEIRTPMNAIIGMTRLALQTELSPKQRDYLCKVEVSSKALLAIINDILDFSKIEAGRLELETIVFSLDDVLNDLAGLVTAKAEEKGLPIHFVIAEEVPTYLVGDPLRLGQVLLNLVNNAVKFTSRGDIAINIALAQGGESTPAADRISLEFSVKDTGIGLTAEQLGGLFQSFSQADTSTTRKYGGTGLGLAICKRIVAMMGGDIKVNSEIGAGSTFTFTADFAQPQGADRQREAPGDAFRGLKALVVDGNEASRNILCLYLESFLFQVTQAGTGEQAIQLLENAVDNPFQRVLMEWNLPKMDGITVARHIKEKLKVTRVPRIIMITVHSRESIVQRCCDLNLDGFLVRPVHPSALLNAVVDAFGRNYLDGYALLHDSRAEVRNEKLHKIKDTKLLLVEDNSINQQVAKETLEQEGFDVTVAINGQEAVQKIRSTYFDAVLMDLQMPVMDGYEATRIIRSDSRFNDLPIIAMTAHAMNDVRERCLQIGMNGYVTKPIDVDKLLLSLVDVINPELRKKSDSVVSGSNRSTEVLLPESLPGIDVQQSLKNVVGNVQLLCQLLMKFHEGFSDAEARVDTFLQADDIESALKFLHTMKGVTANLAMLELKVCIEALEQTLKRQAKYEPELLTDFAKAQHKVLESVERLCRLNSPESAVTPASLNERASHSL